MDEDTGSDAAAGHVGEGPVAEGQGGEGQVAEGQGAEGQGATASGRGLDHQSVLRRAPRTGGRVLSFIGGWVLRLILPLAGGIAALRLFPYHATVQQVPFEVEASLFTRPGFSVQTTLGSWIFPDVTWLPVGVHITPEDIDVLQITRAADGDLGAYAQRLAADLADQVPLIARWLVLSFVIGAVVGLGIAAAINMSARYLRGAPRRTHEIRRRTLQLGAAALVGVLVAGVGVATYNRDWVRNSQLTGTIAAAQLLPGQLSAYYGESNKGLDVLSSIIGIQAELADQIDDAQTPTTALRIMYISDMHLEANYPLVGAYAKNYDVDLIVNTGDEAEFATGVELTPAFRQSIGDVTAKTPMIWVGGNHDSPAVEAVMRSIPGVTVLGTTTATDGGYTVSAGVVDAYGLTIAGVPDPRVYGGPGEYGADDRETVEALQRRAITAAIERAEGRSSGSTDDGAAAGQTSSSAAPGDGDGAAVDANNDPDGGKAPPFDIVATHEPVAADELRQQLPGQIRQTNSGHTHKQNAPDDIQDGPEIDLVEGSTGAGGLDNIARGTSRPPIEFSIESVGGDCQFTRVVRVQIRGQQPADPVADGDTPGDVVSAYGDDVTTTTVYFRPQDVAPGRVCGPQLGISAERPLVLD